MPALRAIALVVVASKPFVWKRLNAAVTMRFRIASLFCARRPKGRGGAARLRGFAFVDGFFFAAIIREYAQQIYEYTHALVKRPAALCSWTAKVLSNYFLNSSLDPGPSPACGVIKRESRGDYQGHADAERLSDGSRLDSEAVSIAVERPRSGNGSPAMRANKSS